MKNQQNNNSNHKQSGKVVHKSFNSNTSGCEHSIKTSKSYKPSGTSNGNTPPDTTSSIE